MTDLPPGTRHVLTPGPDPDVIGDYLAYCEHDREWSPNTVKRYRLVLRSVPDLMTWTVDDADHWWESRRGVPASTRGNELAALRSFFTWATRWDHRPDDPTRRLVAPKKKKTVPRRLGRVELLALLKAADAEGDVVLRRAFCLGAYAGFRISECAKLDWRDVDTEAMRLIADGKGNKERTVGMSNVLLDELLPRPKAGGNVVTGGVRTLAVSTLETRANKFMQRVLADPQVTFHSCRKRWAQLALEKTGNPIAVAQAAGWSSIQTAVHYTTGTEEILDQIAQAVIE